MLLAPAVARFPGGRCALDSESLMTDRINAPRHPPSSIESLEPRRMLAAGDFGSVVTLGSGKIDAARDVAADAEGNLYVAGSFQVKLDLDPHPDRRFMIRSFDDDPDAFIAKYAPDGQVLWARAFGGEHTDSAQRLAVSPRGDVFLAGLINRQATFRTGDRLVNVRTRGDIDPFVAKLSPNGRLRWVGTIGGPRDDQLAGLAVDPAGEVYVSGSIRLEGDLDPGPRGRRITTRGVDDFFISRLSGEDGSLVWSQVFGEESTLETGGALATDGDGHLFIAGSFVREIDFARRQSEQRFTVEAEHLDGYIARLRTATGRFDYVHAIGADDDQTIEDIAVDARGSVFVTGTFESESDFDPSAAQRLLRAEGGQDAFVARYSSNGSLLWASALGPEAGSDEDVELLPLALAVDAAGDVYSTGIIEDEGLIDFDPGPGEFLILSDKDNDAEPIPDEQRRATNAYVSKLSGGAGAWRYARVIGGDEGSLRAHALAADPTTGELIIAGLFIDRADFDPGDAAEIRRTRDDEDDTDIFILRLRG
jgi:hypothetical protein